MRSRNRISGFVWGRARSALVLVLIVCAIGFELTRQSLLSIQKFGLSFWRTETWDPVAGQFGALPFIWGTLYSSILALAIATPVALGIAVFISELCPACLRQPLVFLTELLAAIPSIVYGLWGIFVLVPAVRWLEVSTPDVLRHTPLFSGPPLGVGMLAAALILAIMVIPFTSSVAREVLKSVPAAQREGAYALGATRFEAIRAALFYARTGIIGAIMLGFGRALGETMAVTMVIGNNPRVSASLFAPQYTMSAVIANEFTEAADPLYLNALIEIGLVLFIITLASTRCRAPSSGAWRAIEACRAIGRGARGGGGVNRTRWRKLLSSALRRLLRALGAAGARAAGVRAVLRRQPGHSARSTSRSSPTCRSRSAKPAAVWRTPLSARCCSRRSGRCSRCPIGVVSGIYMSEFAGTRLASAVRFAADTLNGVPSIVIGVFAYGVAVLPFRQFSAIAGGLALGIMMIPIIARTTEELLLLVPGTMREGALALGATRARAVFTVLLPAALPGIVTGVVLALARIAGETAPLLFTSFNNPYFTTSLRQPISSITVQVYTYAISPYADWHRQAWAGALVLVTIVFVCSLLARLATRKLARLQAR